jgi:hypothetical protein
MTKIDALMRKTSDRLFYLYDRWQDEQEYEEWTEYVTAIKNIYGDKYVSSSKEPFRVTLNIDGCHFLVSVDDDGMSCNNIN